MREKQGLGIDEIVGEKRDQIIALAAKHGAHNVRIFGSVARDEATETSDIDFLVRFRPGTTIWDLVGLWQDLAELLQRQVDLATDDTLKEEVKLHVLQEAVEL